MKDLMENFKKFIGEADIRKQLVHQLKLKGIVPGAIIYDYEFGDPPSALSIEAVDESGVSWAESGGFGKGHVNLPDALEAVNEGDWVPSTEFALPKYFSDIEPPKSSRLQNLGIEEVLKSWRKYLDEAIKTTIDKTKNLLCPPATQDLKLNTKNRDAAIHAEHIQYGPLNVDEPGDYWKDIADYWNTEEKAAKASLCGNCVAFDISPRMKDCMPGETSDKDGQLGYCWMHHFKCHSARSCRTWAKGGPITEDDKSAEWQEKNEGSLEEKKDDRCTRIAKRKYDVWPSAYASGAVVKCRQGKIWKGVKEEDTRDRPYRTDAEAKKDVLGEDFLEEKKKKTDYSKEKESGLHGWFSRAGGKGKSKGWVDCNTCRKDKKTGKKTCKSCGRKEGEKRSKYPACRPTPSDCGTGGKGKKWGKKSAKNEQKATNEEQEGWYEPHT